MTEFLQDYGLVVLFFVIAVQASGIPGPPGKTALVAAAILAADGHFSITAVIVVAAVASLLGGYNGYVIGRLGGRPLLDRPWIAARVERPLAAAEVLFAHHGGKAVFIARFLPGLKVVIAAAAGIVKMRWASFALWHAAASVVFAVGWGLGAFFVGAAAVEVAEHYGLVALVPLALLAATSWYGYKRYKRRRVATAV